MSKSGGIHLLAALAAVFVMTSGCAKQGARAVISEAGARNEQALGALSKEVATLKAELNQREANRRSDSFTIAPVSAASKITNPLDAGAPSCSTLAGSDVAVVTGDAETDALRARISSLERKLHLKRTANNMESANVRLLSDEMRGHTSLYALKGEYRVMVIPVQFSDVKFRDAAFLQDRAQGYLFGNEKGSKSSHYHQPPPPKP